jgi:hypothetical protein|tara:strand:+ start:18865 stop:19005 length:141 start_codon:yes stop_codon:yes gene_type:complete
MVSAMTAWLTKRNITMSVLNKYIDKAQKKIINTVNAKTKARIESAH